MSLKSIHIENFRQFKSLKLEKLSGITLIGGKNGAGKTSVLEGIYLAATEVSAEKFNELEIRRRQYRDDSLPPPKQGHSSTTNPWGMLSRVGAAVGKTKFKYENNDSKLFELIIVPVGDFSSHYPAIQSGLSSHGISQADWKNTLICSTESPVDKNKKQTTLIVHKNNSIQEVKLNPDGLPAPHSIGAGSVNLVSIQDWSSISELNKLFSDVKKIPSAYDKFVEVLRVIDPTISSVEILEYRDKLQLHVTNASGSVPISYAGDGALRIATYAATVLASDNSVVLIDEIENGLHYSILSELWKALDKACELTGSQLVATTHSAECIRAAAQNVDEARFSYIRLDQHSDSKTSAEYYSNDEAVQSLDAGIPIR